jgi:hypothetical protein
MKFTRVLLVLIVVMSLVSACSKSGTTDSGSTPPPNPGNGYPKPSSQQDISNQLAIAIKAFKATLFLDMSGMTVPTGQMDVMALNAYSTAISQDSSLKYAYKVVTSYNQTSNVLAYSISYMPYKLGIDPNSVPSGTQKINSYNDLIAVTLNAPLGQQIPIAITNKNLDLTLMQLVLTSNCGYGYLVYTFNADATAIVCSSSPTGLPGAPVSLADCITRINRVKDSVTQILNRIITPGMTNDQKLTAIYNYVTPTNYDFNYNTPNMAFDSQTAFGVFVSKKAVCGGYSWGVNVLANAAGIKCYNVSGSASGVGHAWNNAKYNGSFSYFDATWDNSYTPPRTYQYFAITEASLLQKQHTWNNSMINALVSEN